MRHPLHRADRCCLACHVIAVAEAEDFLYSSHQPNRLIVDQLAGRRRFIRTMAQAPWLWGRGRGH